MQWGVGGGTSSADAPWAPSPGSFSFLGSALGTGLNTRNLGILKAGCWGGPGPDEGAGHLEPDPGVGHYLAEGLVSPEAAVSGPNPSAGKEQGVRGESTVTAHPRGEPLQRPVGSWLSLTWAEALTLLRGALGPLLG